MESQRVECIAECDKEGKITPMRIRFETREGEACTIKPIKVLNRNETKGFEVANTIHIFRCQSIVDGQTVPFTLQYETNSMLWCMLT